MFRCVAPDGSTVALKLPHLSLTDDHGRHRFNREAEVLGRLSHPNVPRLIARGEVEIGAETRPYLAMDFVDGVSLRTHLRQESVPTNAKIELLADAADTLAYAHDRGVVHRDLKPSNLLVAQVDGHPTIKVIDFGVAQFRNDPGRDVGPQSTLTATGAASLLGTIGYLSPEHFSPGDVTPRSDLFSLGVIAYEAFAGVLPYGLPSGSENLAAWAPLTAPILPLPEAAGSRDLARVIGRAIERDPKARYRSAREFAEDLRRVARGVRPSVRPIPWLTSWWWLRARRWARGQALALLLAVPIFWAVVLLLSTRADERAARHEFSLICREVRDIDFLRGSTNLTPETMRSLSQRIDAVVVRLRKLPTSPLAPHLNSYLRFRQGEMHCFLWQAVRDRSDLIRASECWMEAWRIPRERNVLHQFQEDPVLRAELLGFSRVTPAAADGLAHRYLGRLASPRSEYELARLRYAYVLDDVEQRGIDVFFYDEAHGLGDPKEVHQSFERLRAEAYSNLGIAMTDIGVNCDSLAALEDALRLFAIADTSVAFRNWPEPRRVELWHRARALLARAELLHYPAGLEIARDAILESQGMGADDPDFVLLTQTALSRAARVEAKLAPSAAARIEGWERADQVWRVVHALPSRANDPYVRAGALLEEATLRAEQVIHRSTTMDAIPRRALEEADAQVDTAATLLSPDREPAQYAALLLVRGQVAAARWALLRDEAARREGQEALELSLTLLPAAQSSRHERLIQSARQTLSAR
ncbi:MAG: serine/threonine protein kinase [Candidatus Eisenbacteria bacterium]|nr:serine/threonine protein kinase [Candidatus Eisenbacteria bacterium]